MPAGPVPQFQGHHGPFPGLVVAIEGELQQGHVVAGDGGEEVVPPVHGVVNGPQIPLPGFLEVVFSGVQGAESMGPVGIKPVGQFPFQEGDAVIEPVGLEVHPA